MATQQMFYDKVVPVTATRHRDWCVALGGEYAFSKKVNSVPLTAVEFPSAAMEYVIVFAGNEDAVMPAVILGLRANENFYLAERNTWNARYVPAFVRRYPFIFSSRDEGKTFALCIDESFAGINRDGRGERLFDVDGKRTQFVENVLAFLQVYQVQFQRTRALCQRLKELKLLEPMRARIVLGSKERVSLSGFMSVSRDRLKALPADVLAAMVKSDEMELIYLHLQSMRNFATLKDRVVDPVAADAVAGMAEPRSPDDASERVKTGDARKPPKEGAGRGGAATESGKEHARKPKLR